MKAYLWGVALLLLITACSNDSIFQGVSQDSSYDAKVEDAAISLDNGNYDQVISELSVMYTTTAPNPEVGRLLASGYMGMAWVDLTGFIVNSTSSGIDPFDVVASMITSPEMNIIADKRFIGHDDNNQTDALKIDDLLSNITMAKYTLEILGRNARSSHDDTIQLGMASAAHFIMFLGSKTADALNRTLYYSDVKVHQPGIVPVPMNTRAYQYYKSAPGIAYKYSWGNVGPGSFVDKTTTGGIPSYQDDLININNAVTAFNEAYPGPNGLKNSLNNFICSVLGIKTDVPVTDELIMTYTSAGINAYVQRLAQP